MYCFQYYFRQYYLLGIIVILGSCQAPTTNADANTPSVTSSEEQAIQEKEMPIFAGLIDAALVEGTILLYDPQAETYYSNDFAWARTGQLPASTFKIAHSMIALETGVMAHDSVIIKWDGEPKWVKSWEQDLSFRQAFQYSCLPCYQQLAPQVGIPRMTEWLAKLDYGSTFVPDSTNLDLFWVAGDWRITAFEQIDFLQRFYNHQLPISKRTEDLVKDFMILEQKPSYTLRGKTGWSIVDDHNNGWFVGYVESKDKVYYFATNVEPKEGFDMQNFNRIRKSLARGALEGMKWL